MIAEQVDQLLGKFRNVGDSPSNTSEDVKEVEELEVANDDENPQ